MERFEPLSKKKPEPDPLQSPDIIEPPMQDHTEFLRPLPPTPNSFAPKSHKFRTSLVALVLIVLLAVGAYVAVFKPHAAPSAKAPTTISSTAKKTVATTASTPKIPTTTYTSSNFNLSLGYPQDWNVTSDTATSLLVESPVMNLKAANGKTISGKVLVTIQPQGQVPSSFGSQDASAVLASTLITYSNPTSSQRAQTYISFLQYAATTTSDALDGVYITGDYGYQQAQNIPRTDIMALNPLVTVTFGACADAKCTSLTTTNIAASAWNDSSFSAPILTLLESLSFS